MRRLSLDHILWAVIAIGLVFDAALLIRLSRLSLNNVVSQYNIVLGVTKLSSPSAALWVLIFIIALVVGNHALTRLLYPGEVFWQRLSQIVNISFVWLIFIYVLSLQSFN